MSDWTSEQARQVAAPEEVQVVTRRRDGSLRRPRTIWLVGDRRRIFIRSTNGRDADWFRWAIATGCGQVIAGGRVFDVTFSQVTDEDDLAAADSGYRSKYGRYQSIVDHLVDVEPRSATLEVTPA